VRLLKAEELRASLRISDGTIHIGDYTCDVEHARRIAIDILALTGELDAAEAAKIAPPRPASAALQALRNRLEVLMAEWRADADQGDTEENHFKNECANELEAALRGIEAPPAGRG
jgi:hypothetical protein